MESRISTNDQSPERKRLVHGPRACPAPIAEGAVAAAQRAAAGRLVREGPDRQCVLVYVRVSSVLGFALLFLGGCGRDTEDQTVSDGGVTSTAGKGAVSVKLSAAPGTLDFEQHTQLQLEIIAEKGVTVLDNEYGRTLAEGDRRFEYRIVRSDKKLAVPTDDGRLRWSYGFEVEFFLPGNYELPPAIVSFVEPSVAGGSRLEASAITTPAEVQTVATNPLTLVVRPPPRPELSQAELMNITRLDPVELPTVWSRWWWLVPVFIILVVVAVVLLARRLRRSHPDIVVRIPPHEWARQQIAVLVAEDLLAGGRVQEFHYRISGIVRGYVERRFGVCAPEMTTEEFLGSAAKDIRFAGGMTDELNRFLSACDLVKYARHQPGTEQSHTVLRAAGEFVERTREHVSRTDEGRVSTRTQLRAGTGPRLGFEERME